MSRTNGLALFRTLLFRLGIRKQILKNMSCKLAAFQRMTHVLNDHLLNTVCDVNAVSFATSLKKI